ncbi:MAG: hypothetical protein ACOYOM_15835 [Chloroflexota bacterium]
MGVSVKAILGSVAVCGVMLLAGCGGSSGPSGDAGWNPPRPTGVTDEKWATIVDPASLSVEELSGGYCPAVKPTSAEVEAKVLEYPGSTVAELNAYYDYVTAYVAPLCADLPTETGAKGAKRVPTAVLSDL